MAEHGNGVYMELTQIGRYLSLNQFRVPAAVDERTGVVVDFYSGKPLDRARPIRTIEQDVAELER